MKTSTQSKSTETTGAANKGKGAKAPRKARAGVELDAGAQARIKAGVEKALQPVAEAPPAEPEPGEAPPVQPVPPAQPEPGEVAHPAAAETSGGTDAAETSGGTEPGEVASPVAEVASGDPAPDAGETSGGEAPAPAQPSAESAEVPAVAVAPAPTKKGKRGKKGKAPKAAPPPAPAPVQPAASGPVPAWRSSPARILRSALSPLDPRWYDWEKLESQIPGVREARALLQTAYEAATRLEAAASGKPAKRKVEPGALVRISAKHAKLYDGVLDAGEVLRVDAVPGTHAHCKTNRGAGERATLPVAHLELAGAAA
jgi:hypothetical protein